MLEKEKKRIEEVKRLEEKKILTDNASDVNKAMSLLEKQIRELMDAKSVELTAKTEKKVSGKEGKKIPSCNECGGEHYPAQKSKCETIKKKNSSQKKKNSEEPESAITGNLPIPLATIEKDKKSLLAVYGVFEGSRVKIGTAVAVSNGFIFNKHFWKGADSLELEKDTKIIKVDKSEWKSFKETDFGFFYYLSSGIPIMRPCECNPQTTTGVVWVNDHFFGSFCQSKSPPFEWMDDGSEKVLCDYPSSKGTCGSPVKHGGSFVGIHASTLGADNGNLFLGFSKEMLVWLRACQEKKQ
jgi:hypothetical protein